MIDEPKLIFEPSKVSQEIEAIPRDPPKVLKIESALSTAKKMKMITLLRENQDVFARKHEDLLGIDRKIIQHC